MFELLLTFFSIETSKCSLRVVDKIGEAILAVFMARESNVVSTFAALYFLRMVNNSITFTFIFILIGIDIKIGDEFFSFFQTSLYRLNKLLFAFEGNLLFKFVDN